MGKIKFYNNSTKEWELIDSGGIVDENRRIDVKDIEKIESELSDKIDKEDGKKLSTNDYDNRDKEQNWINQASISSKESSDTSITTDHKMQVNASNQAYIKNNMSQVNASVISGALNEMSQVNASNGSWAEGKSSQINASSFSNAKGMSSQINASDKSEANGYMSQVNTSLSSFSNGKCSQVNASEDSSAKYQHSQINASIDSKTDETISQINTSIGSTTKGMMSQINASVMSEATGGNSQINASINSKVNKDMGLIDISKNSEVANPNSAIIASDYVRTRNPYTVVGGFGDKLSEDNINWELDSKEGLIYAKNDVYTENNKLSDIGNLDDLVVRDSETVVGALNNLKHNSGRPEVVIGIKNEDEEIYNMQKEYITEFVDPDEDLSLIINKYIDKLSYLGGTIILSEGVYNLNSPIVFNKGCNIRLKGVSSTLIPDVENWTSYTDRHGEELHHIIIVDNPISKTGLEYNIIENIRIEGLTYWDFREDDRFAIYCDGDSNILIDNVDIVYDEYVSYRIEYIKGICLSEGDGIKTVKNSRAENCNIFAAGMNSVIDRCDSLLIVVENAKLLNSVANKFICKRSFIDNCIAEFKETKTTGFRLHESFCVNSLSHGLNNGFEVNTNSTLKSSISRNCNTGVKLYGHSIMEGCNIENSLDIGVRVGAPSLSPPPGGHTSESIERSNRHRTAFMMNNFIDCKDADALNIHFDTFKRSVCASNVIIGNIKGETFKFHFVNNIEIDD